MISYHLFLLISLIIIDNSLLIKSSPVELLAGLYLPLDLTPRLTTSRLLKKVQHFKGQSIVIVFCGREERRL